MSDKITNLPKYIVGYVNNEDDINKLIDALGTNAAPNREMDAYDPYHTSDSKKEEFWYDESGEKLIDGRTVQKKYDNNTDTFKRSLYSEYGYKKNDFWYEDPFLPMFQLAFDDNSPLFNDDSPSKQNTIKSFMEKYGYIDANNYERRNFMWMEFRNAFFKIFEKSLNSTEPNNKPYYITKIIGIGNLNKKIINYGTHGATSDADKLTITMNEDVSMIAWYISELYKNLVYSYKNQRFMFPENVIRFNMDIKINDIRNFEMPQSNNKSSEYVKIDKSNINNKIIKNIISPKSQIVYTLHDCTFNFFESRNFDDEMEIGGYSASVANTPKSLSFDINYKSVTRYSNFPLIHSQYYSDSGTNGSLKISPWENKLADTSSAEEGTLHNYYDNIDRIVINTSIESKGNSNAGVQQETGTDKLRDQRSITVNGLVQQINSPKQKIDPDNVYSTNFSSALESDIKTRLQRDLELGV